ncbi:MAG TPA: hypothetical protein VK980_10290 [Sphingomonas sp.]|nr:hypothetical protein [Sphingomonas sp.]
MILLALLLAAAPAPPAAPPSRLDADAAAVARAGAALDPHLGDRASFDGEPGTGRLIAAQEQAVQRWVARWLDLHPGATIAALTEAGKRLGKGWSIAGTDLGRGDLLITVSRSWMSDIFIVGRDARGVHRLRWALSAPQRRLDRKADFSLSQWRPAVQNSNCPDCALMSGPDSGRLPDAADGTARFWIEASYAQEMGATMGAQLSLWSWRHGAARPLLVHDFAIMAEQHGPTLRGTTLHVPSKGEWHSLFACGSCFGRVTDLRFVVGPGRVRMLPPVSETPELDLIDRVYARVLARRPVGALAAPSALRIIRAQQRDNLAERDPQLRKLTGMVSGWYRWRSHGRRWLCLADDGTDPMAFAFDASLHRITEVRVLGLNACQGDQARN